MGSAIEAAFILNFGAGREPGFRLDVDLVLPGSGITVVFGPSGSGKTTLLRCIAGLEKPARGRVIIDNKTWQEDAFFMPPHHRPLGYVFQESSLFPHLSASGNLDYAVKRAPRDRAVVARDHIIDLMRIDHLLGRYPAGLSGGERQRVAIARALLIQPDLLLMDEPLSSLDATRKQEILPYLERLRDELDIPVLYVSHAVDEVARLANHLVVLDSGRVAGQGALGEVMARFDLPLGPPRETGVVLEATVTDRDPRWHLLQVNLEDGALWIPDSGQSIGERIRIRIPASDISLALENHTDTSILNRLPAQVVESTADSDPAMTLVRLKTGSDTLIARLTRRSAEHLGIRPGSRVIAQIKSVAIVR